MTFEGQVHYVFPMDKRLNYPTACIGVRVSVELTALSRQIYRGPWFSLEFKA